MVAHKSSGKLSFSRGGDEEVFAVAPHVSIEHSAGCNPSGATARLHHPATFEQDVHIEGSLVVGGIDVGKLMAAITPPPPSPPPPSPPPISPPCPPSPPPSPPPPAHAFNPFPTTENGT